MAVNIQRGRDHGVPDFNTVRQYYGLPALTSFDQLIPVGNTNLDAAEQARVSFSEGHIHPRTKRTMFEPV